MPFTPLFDRVLIEIDDRQQQTQSGIVLPRQQANVGRVIAIGEGRWATPTEFYKPRVQVEDKVLFEPGNGFYLTLEESSNKKHILVRETDILGIYK